MTQHSPVAADRDRGFKKKTPLSIKEKMEMLKRKKKNYRIRGQKEEKKGGGSTGDDNNTSQGFYNEQ